jgi:hypothetical protein
MPVCPGCPPGACANIVSEDAINPAIKNVAFPVNNEERFIRPLFVRNG